MRSFVSLVILISLVSGGCHRSGGYSKKEASPKTDSSKTIRAPRMGVDSGKQSDAKVVREPAVSSNGSGGATSAARKSNTHEHKSVVSHAPAVHAPSPVGPSAKMPSSARKSPQTSPLIASRKSQAVTAVQKGGGAPSRRAEASDSVSSSKPRTRESAPEPTLARTNEAPAAPADFNANGVGEASKPDSVSPMPPTKASEAVAPATSPVAHVEPVSENPPPQAEPPAELPSEKTGKPSAAKPDAPHADRPAEKETAAEVAAEPAAVAPAPKLASAKPGAGVAAKGTASQSKLSPNEKKKQADAQKREEVQRAAEQSYEMGLQYIRESRDADAIKAFRQAVKLAPDSADAWLRLAYLCEKEGKTEEALRAFKEAKRLWSF